MTGAASSGVKPVLPVTRTVFLIAAVLAVIAGIQLYILTDSTDHYFAWTIAQPLSATFIGTGFWTGAALLVLAARERAWADIRIAVAAVAAFVPVMLLATLLHLDRFPLETSDTNAWVAAWAWLIVYAVVPFVILAVVVAQLRAPGGDPPRTIEIGRRTRILIAANALISLVLGLALFLVPESVFGLWPWQLTALTAQAIGAGFFSVFAASVQFLREGSLNRSRGGTVSYTLIGALQLLASARYSSTVEWSRPGTWLYVAFLVTFVAGGVYTTVLAWRPRHLADRFAEQA